MADYDTEDRVNDGNEWDVVSLTASTYAAAPSYWINEYNNTNGGGGGVTFGGETSRTMLLSDHFVFPPSQHENLPLEPDVDEQVEEERDVETNEGSFSGDYDEEKNEMYTLGKQSDGKQQFGGLLEEGETSRFKEVGVSKKDGDLLSDHHNTKMPNDDKIQRDIPPASWWKRHASSLYLSAKESNSFWSIFVAAAVMGLVVIGQRWQQERWQILQLKLHINANDEKMVRMLGPLTRLKDAVIGSHHRMSFLSSSPVEL